MSTRRFIAVVQDARGYPPQGELDPAPPDGPAPPVIHSVVLAGDFEAQEAENERLREALTDITELDYTDGLSRAVEIAREALADEGKR